MGFPRSSTEARNVASPTVTSSIKRRNSPDAINQHWSKPENFNPDWALRARAAGEKLIIPGSVICDLGCGPNNYAEMMPPGCVHLRADVTIWDEAVEYCDLNKGILPLRALKRADTAMMLGVLEYIHDPHRLLTSLRRHVRTLAFTYAASDVHHHRVPLWATHMSVRQLRDVLRRAGFDIVRLEREKTMLLVRAERMPWPRFVFQRVVGATCRKPFTD